MSPRERSRAGVRSSVMASPEKVGMHGPILAHEDGRITVDLRYVADEWRYVGFAGSARRAAWTTPVGRRGRPALAVTSY